MSIDPAMIRQSPFSLPFLHSYYHPKPSTQRTTSKQKNHFQVSTFKIIAAAFDTKNPALS